MAPRLRVLMLEDNPADAELLLQELRRAGFEPDVQCVDCERDYLSSLDPSFDLILADYNLPQFDALRALGHLQVRQLDIPFIVVTGSFEEHAVECIKQGATDYLLKDRLARLGTAITHALEQKQLRDEKRHADAILRASESRFRSLIENGSEAILLVGPDGTILYTAPSIERILGYQDLEVAGRNLVDFVHPETQAYVQRALARMAAAPGRVLGEEYRAQHKDGSYRHLEIVATNLLTDPSVGGIVINARDVTERTALEEQLRHQALYDPLTGLANRALFMDTLGRGLRGGSRRGTAVAVMLLDLDGFKLINDSLGHDTGDEMLMAVGSRLADSLRPNDTLARFGGDEFIVLLDDVRSPVEPLRVADRLLASLRSAFELRQQRRFIAASIGIAWSGPEPALRQPEDLLREADLALYQAKAEGKGRTVVFKSSMSRHVVERLNLETDLRLALERSELRLYYQPQVDLATGQIVGLEALVRWQHPKQGLMGPAKFIPVAEENGLIVPLGRWVLEEACRQARAWSQMWPTAPPLVISVNASARQLQRPEFVDQVSAALKASELAPGLLEIEITESVAMQNPAEMAETLQQLKGLGVRLAIDDFGTGYSSLSYLQSFPVHTLKVDQSFVAKLDSRPESAAIIRAVVALARALNVSVTAEGAETAEQAAWLRDLGCTLAQGFYFSKPLPGHMIQILIEPHSAPANAS